MKSQSSILNRIADLDPASGYEHPGSATDQQLMEVLALPGDARNSHASQARRRRSPAGAILALGSVAAAGALIFVMVTGAGESAFASWTATARELTAADITSLDTLCDSSALTVDSGSSTVVAIPVAPVISEARGDYLYRVSVSDEDSQGNAYTECFVALDGPTPMAIGSAAIAASPLPPVGSRELSTVQNGTASWSEESQAGALPGHFTSVFGQAGSDITGVTVTTSSGQRVTATVENGWWAAWVPHAETIQPTAIATLSSGDEIEVTLQTAG